MESIKFPYLKTLQEQITNQLTQITIDEYRRLRDNYDLILKVIWINEKYNMILDNYYDFELEVLNDEKRLLEINDIEQMITVGQEVIVNFNRKLANILCSVRMYIDQTQHDLSSLKMESFTNRDFHLFTNKQYDKSVGYQVMEILRNHMQHQGLIIDGLTIIKPIFNKSDDYIWLTVEVDYKRLKSIDKYKQKVKLDETLEAINSRKFNIMWFLREYINGIIEIQKQLHNRLDKTVTESILEIENILNKKYLDIPLQVGVFSGEDEFLLQYNYIINIKNKQKEFKSCYEDRKIFKTPEYIRGNFQKETIKYNMT